MLSSLRTARTPFHARTTSARGCDGSIETLQRASFSNVKLIPINTLKYSVVSKCAGHHGDAACAQSSAFQRASCRASSIHNCFETRLRSVRPAPSRALVCAAVVLALQQVSWRLMHTLHLATKQPFGVHCVAVSPRGRRRQQQQQQQYPQKRTAGVPLAFGGGWEVTLGSLLSTLLALGLVLWAERRSCSACQGTGMAPCPSCRGTGWAPGARAQVCGRCDGVARVPCPRCAGRRPRQRQSSRRSTTFTTRGDK
jgi:hypothetical protein